MKKILLYFIINIFLICNANAVTLIEALKIAYNKNSKLNAERESLKISQENINISKSEFLPTITISSYKSDENTSKLKNRSGADVNIDDVNPLQKSLLIEQSLYDAGRKADLEKNKILFEISKLKLKKVEQEILYASIEAYTRIILSKKVLKINLSNVSLLERQLDTNKARLESGKINLTDLAQSESSLAGAQAKLIDAQNKIITSQLDFKKTIGVIDNLTEINEEYNFNFKLPESLSSANSISKKNNPILNIAKLEYEQAKKDVIIAKSELSPTAKLSFQATETDDVSSTYDEKDQEVLKATISWPIYSGGKNIAGYKKNKNLKIQKQLLLDDAKKTNETSVASAWSNYQASKSFLNSIRLQVKASEIANEGVTAEYESGLGRTTLDVIQSNSILLNSKISLTNAERNFLLSQFKLLQTIGLLTATNLSLK